MARYSALLGRRIEVRYHSGETVLPATGILAADSGRSIFLEESVRQMGVIRTFRWEIPYNHIVRLSESAMPAAARVSKVRALALQPDGKIFVGGENSGARRDSASARDRSDTDRAAGTPDPNASTAH